MKKFLLFISLIPISCFTMDNNPSYWNRFKAGISNSAIRMRKAFGDYARTQLRKAKEIKRIQHDRALLEHYNKEVPKFAEYLSQSTTKKANAKTSELQRFYRRDMDRMAEKLHDAKLNRSFYENKVFQNEQKMQKQLRQAGKYPYQFGDQFK